MKSIFEGINYCHSCYNIIHRDLKPQVFLNTIYLFNNQNIFIDNDGKVKIGDFGLARLLSPCTGALSPNVTSLWYKAPEILFCLSSYDTKCDIWSIGCIFYELVNNKPLFSNVNSEVDMIFKMIKIFGSIKNDDLPSISDFPMNYQNLPSFNKQSIDTLLPNCDNDGIELFKV